MWDQALTVDITMMKKFLRDLHDPHAVLAGPVPEVRDEFRGAVTH